MATNARNSEWKPTGWLSGCTLVAACIASILNGIPGNELRSLILLQIGIVTGLTFDLFYNGYSLTLLNILKSILLACMFLATAYLAVNWSAAMAGLPS
jgi:hypothetical protein